MNMRGRRTTESSMTQCILAFPGFAALAVLLASVALGAAAAGGAEHRRTFSYDKHAPDGPQHWGDLRPEWALCRDGREQSPIDIDTKEKSCNDLTRLNTSYVPANAVLFLTDHGLEVDVAHGNAGRFVLDGEDYLLKQFHFHAPSEHVIDGVRPPLEMHMVHETADGRKIAVIGMPFQRGQASPFLDEFWGHLGELTPGSHGKSKEIDIGKLLVDEPHLRLGPRYARYMGSLTTPPCTQNVRWTVCLEEWNTVSDGQLAAMKKLLPKPFARPIQKIHDRSVQFYNP